jgi:hypothetical protein
MCYFRVVTEIYSSACRPLSIYLWQAAQVAADDVILLLQCH